MKKAIETIQEQTGLTLNVCPQFPEVYTHNGRSYFNVILKERCTDSLEFDILNSYAERSGLISVQPNGVNRVAVFFDNLKD